MLLLLLLLMQPAQRQRWARHVPLQPGFLQLPQRVDHPHEAMIISHKKSSRNTNQNATKYQSIPTVEVCIFFAGFLLIDLEE